MGWHSTPNQPPLFPDDVRCLVPMCVIVTRDVPSRFRGFLASCMLEIAAGAYTQLDMFASVRERVRCTTYSVD
jgi:hypothetical protein